MTERDRERLRQRGEDSRKKERRRTESDWFVHVGHPDLPTGGKTRNHFIRLFRISAPFALTRGEAVTEQTSRHTHCPLMPRHDHRWNNKISNNNIKAQQYLRGIF